MSFSLPLDQPTKDRSASTVEALAFFLENAATGVARFQKEKVLRQIQFQEGGILATASNLKSETPGGHLEKLGILSSDQFQTYLRATTQEKKKPWAAVQEISNADAAQIQIWKKDLVVEIFRGLMAAGQMNLSFQPSAPTQAKPILGRMEVALTLASNLGAGAISEFCTELKADSAILSQDVDPPEELTPEEKGLFTVAKNSSTVGEVFEGSFLEKDRIYQLLLSYNLAGLLNFESAQVAEEKAHLNSLSEEELEKRKRALDLHESMNSASFYDWLGLDNQVEEEDVRKTVEDRRTWLASENTKKLFLPKDQHLVSEVLEHLEEVAKILTSEEKRKEYDAFLAEGSGGSFLDQSLSLKEDRYLKQAHALEKSKKLQDVLATLDQGMKALPDSSRLLEAFIGFFCRYVKGSDAKAGQRVVREIQRGTKMDRPSPGFFAAAGRWFEKSGQIENAKKFYTQALEMDPHQISARQAMEKIDPKTIAPILLRSFERHLQNLTFYDLLGVHRKASRSDIQKAYRDCTKRFHPDRFYHSTDEGLKTLAKDIYKRMVEAYMTLKDERKRADYDASVREGLGQFGLRDEVQGPSIPSKQKSEPQTPQGKKFYKMAVDSLRTGNKSSAIMNLQLGLQVEPDCQLFQEKLAQLQRR